MRDPSLADVALTADAASANAQLGLALIHRIVGGFQQLAGAPILDEGNLVHRYGKEKIPGDKTFTGLVNVDEVRFVSGVTPANTLGTTYWDDDSQTLSTILDPTNGVVLQHGQEIMIRCVNKTGVTITNGQVVYVNDAQGNRPTATLAKADAIATSMVIGVATQDILDNAEGFITTLGIVHGFDTSGYAHGDKLFLSATVAGALTNVVPVTPGYMVLVAHVLNSTNNGSIFVHAEQPIALDTTLAANTDLASPSQKAVKAYVATAVSAYVPLTRTISTMAPLTGGGDLSADRTLAISAATTTDPGSMSAADKTKLDQFVLTAAKTFTFTNSLTISGTDGSTLNIGGGGTLGTAAYVADNTLAHLAGVETFTAQKIFQAAIPIVLEDSHTDSTNKNARMGATAYVNSQVPAGMMYMATALASNILAIGGGTSGFQAATSVRIYAAAAVNTATGTLCATITTTLMTVAVPFKVSDTTDASSLTTASAIFSGGVAITKKTYHGDMIVVPKTTNIGIQVDTTTPTFPWRDLIGDVNPRTAAGAGTPTYAAFQGNIYGYWFALNDVVDFMFHMPHDYVPGTDIYLHIHWSHNGTAITGNVVFTHYSTYAKGFNQANFPAEVTNTITYNTTNIATTPQYRHRVDEIQLSGTGSASLLNTPDLEIDGIIKGRIKLTTLPTITAGNLFIHTIDIHYQSSSIGTKAKAPNFYT